MLASDIQAPESKWCRCHPSDATISNLRDEIQLHRYDGLSSHQINGGRLRLEEPVPTVLDGLTFNHKMRVEDIY